MNQIPAVWLWTSHFTSLNLSSEDWDSVWMVVLPRKAKTYYLQIISSATIHWELMLCWVLYMELSMIISIYSWGHQGPKIFINLSLVTKQGSDRLVIWSQVCLTPKLISYHILHHSRLLTQHQTSSLQLSKLGLWDEQRGSSDILLRLGHSSRASVEHGGRGWVDTTSRADTQRSVRRLCCSSPCVWCGVDWSLVLHVWMERNVEEVEQTRFNDWPHIDGERTRWMAPHLCGVAG